MSLTNDDIVVSLREDMAEAISDGPPQNCDYSLGYVAGIARAIELVESFTGDTYIRGSESGRGYTKGQIQQLREYIEQHGVTRKGAALFARGFHRTERGVFQKMQSLNGK